MLTAAEAADCAARFGAAVPQVERDHLISHLLRGMSFIAAGDVVFVGGTALARTHLASGPWSRLSEDVDLLITAEDHRAVLRRIEAELPRSVRREFPDMRWTTRPTSVRPPEPATLATRDLSVRVQLLPARRGWDAWLGVPTETRSIETRYHDITEPVRLRTPTASGFAAMKLAAWEDRRLARDLFDLAGLAAIGAIDAACLRVFEKMAARPPDPLAYRAGSSGVRDNWRAQLAHQTGSLPTSERCLAAVAEALDLDVGGAEGSL